MKNGPRSTLGVEVAVTRSLSSARAFVKQWASLAEEDGGGNPFVHPDWLITWAERYLRSSEDIFLLTARHADKLVGVAPYYRLAWGGGVAHSVQLWGTGRHSDLVEMPALLTAQDQRRTVARALVRELCRRSSAWDWAQVPLPDSLWFEPDWLPRDGSVFVMPGLVRGCVVRQLTAGQATPLKRNVRESVRRARNRLTRAFPGEWRIDCSSNREEIMRAMPDLASLHAARSRMPEREVHRDALSDMSEYKFLLDVLDALSDRNGACIYRLMVREKPVAALLVFRTKDATYISLSGMSAEAWEFSPTTLLQARAIEDADELKQGFVNFSAGPNTAKLRWSEEVRANFEFVIVPNRPLAMALFSGYRLASAGASIRRERRRHSLLSLQADKEVGVP